jgi:hypothetical protein
MNILEAVGVKLVYSVSLKRKVSQEACTAGFYVKNSFPDNPDEDENLSTLSEEWRKCSDFWDPNTALQTVKDLYDEVREGLDIDLSTRHTRKRKSNN